MTVFINPLPSQKFIDHFYDKGYPYTVDSVSAKRMRQNALKIIRKLRALLPAGKSVLDVGSGYGDFLDAIKHSGIAGRGIEPAVNLYNFSVKRHLNVSQETLEEFSRLHKNTKFDFITVIHLVEHVKNPTRFISQCAKHLKKNGIMYIETPNISSHLFTAEKENYTFLTPPDHTVLFSPKSLEKIAKRRNLIIEELRTFSYPEHIAPIVRNLIKKPATRPAGSVKKTATVTKPKKSIKYFIGNKFLYPILTPVLNIGHKGSILACYVRKTS